MSKRIAPDGHTDNRPVLVLERKGKFPVLLSRSKGKQWRLPKRPKRTWIQG